MRKFRFIIILFIILAFFSGCSLLYEEDAVISEVNGVVEELTWSDRAKAVRNEEITAGTKENYLPLTDLFAHSAIMDISISPNGDKIVYYKDNDSNPTVEIMHIKTGEITNVAVPNVNGSYYFYWAADNESIIFFIDNQGDENYSMWVTVPEGEPRDLTPWDDVQVRLIDLNIDYPDSLLASVNKYDPSLHDLYKVNIKTGEWELISKNPGNAIEWIIDDKQIPICRVSINDKGGTYVEVLEDDKYKLLKSFDGQDAMVVDVLYMTNDGKNLVVLDSPEGNTAQLYFIDMKTGEREWITGADDFDISGVMWDYKTGDVQAVSYQKDRYVWEVLDENIAAL